MSAKSTSSQAQSVGAPSSLAPVESTPEPRRLRSDVTPVRDSEKEGWHSSDEDATYKIDPAAVVGRRKQPKPGKGKRTAGRRMKKRKIEDGEAWRIQTQKRKQESPMPKQAMMQKEREKTMERRARTRV
jgi:hypothetical protein